MYRITIALVIFGVCLAGTARAADEAAGAAGDLKQVCQDSVAQISRGDAKGFVPLWRNTAVAPPADDQDKEARAQTQDLQVLQEQYGAFLGCELIEEKKIGATLCRYTFLAKYEKNAICWWFTLYRPRDQWKLLHFNWTDNPGAVDSLFR